MRDSFSEYKKTLELNLQKVPILYSGDALRSSDFLYSEIKRYPHISPSFMINCIVDIYNQSFKKMELISKEVMIVDAEQSENILDKILESCGKDVKFIFTSEKSKSKLSNTLNTNKTRSLPGYLYPIDKLTTSNIDLLTSPLIEEDDDENIFYATDNPIQSLVYSIQNMDYLIEKYKDDTWKHTMNYKLYYCKFKSWKIVLKSISKLRHDKIIQILDGN